jgi:very-short-patch-repair endonuclease
MSYLEEWFYDKIIKHELQKEYDIVMEFCEYPYFIDFAFINEKIAVELDGGQHFKNEKAIQSDISRENYLKEKGWIFYRIAYFENKEKAIGEFLLFLKSKEKKPKELSDNLIKHSEWKRSKVIKRNKSEYLEHLKLQNYEKEKENIKKVLEANIDFSKFGWVTKVSKLIDKPPPRINKWMKKYLLEFYEKNCFKKAME